MGWHARARLAASTAGDRCSSSTAHEEIKHNSSFSLAGQHATAPFRLFVAVGSHSAHARTHATRRQRRDRCHRRDCCQRLCGLRPRCPVRVAGAPPRLRPPEGAGQVRRLAQNDVEPGGEQKPRGAPKHVQGQRRGQRYHGVKPPCGYVQRIAWPEAGVKAPANGREVSESGWGRHRLVCQVEHVQLAHGRAVVVLRAKGGVSVDGMR